MEPAWHSLRRDESGSRDPTIDFDIYVKDLLTGDIVLASTSDTGIKANAFSLLPSLSGDGTKVAFYSLADNLDPDDTDSSFDVYVKDLLTGDVTLASTSDAGVKGNNHSLWPSLSADGTKLAFYSFATNLDPADSDGFPDIFVKDSRPAPSRWPRLPTRVRRATTTAFSQLYRRMGTAWPSIRWPPLWILPTQMK